MFEHYVIFEIVNLLAIVMGIVFGVVAQKSKYCFAGAINDYIGRTCTKRGASVIVAMITAIVGTYVLTLFFEVDLMDTPWRQEDVNYFSIIIGGTLFGIGMMIADGCGGRHLVKFAEGDSKSLLTLVFIAIFAYSTKNGFLNPAVYSLYSNETLLNLSGYVGNSKMNLYIVLAVLFVLLWKLTKGFKNMLAHKEAVVIGLLIVAGWYLTGVYAAETLYLDTRYVKLANMSFVGPPAQALELFTHYKNTNLDFGISLVLGVVFGAFVMSRFEKKATTCCSVNPQQHKLKNSMIGGALMGVGGIMAIGCTVGQGLTGLSTLAFASFISIFTIFVSSYLTAIYMSKK